MDMKVIFGIIVSFVGIALGFVLDNGHLSAIIQISAAIIVFVGTFGAVIVGSTDQDIYQAKKLIKKLFNKDYETMAEKISKNIYECSVVARKDTILAIEKMIPNFQHPYMQNIFRFVIDGVDPKVIQEIFEEQIRKDEEKMLSGAKLFTDAGGFAPTIGILGAVLGLIHVMGNLTDTTKLGTGIAVAFVATLYGVGSANLIFLPLANKFKRIIQAEVKVKEMILAGALSIVKGYNPYIIQEQMKSYLTTKES